jgi:hypothetical protein
MYGRRYRVPENAVQFRSKDGCIYIYSTDDKRWFKFCPVVELPLDVKRQVQELKDKADILGDTV